jgi:hypothetical protein
MKHSGFGGRLAGQKSHPRISGLLVGPGMDLLIEGKPGAQGPLHKRRAAEDFFDQMTLVLERPLDRCPLLRGAGLPLDPVIFMGQTSSRHAQPEDSPENSLLGEHPLDTLLEDGAGIDLIERLGRSDDKCVPRSLHGTLGIDADGYRKRQAARKQQRTEHQDRARFDQFFT